MYINPIIVPSQKNFNINIIIEMKSKGPKYIAATENKQPFSNLSEFSLSSSKLFKFIFSTS